MGHEASNYPRVENHQQLVFTTLVALNNRVSRNFELK